MVDAKRSAFSPCGHWGGVQWRIGSKVPRAGSLIVPASLALCRRNRGGTICLPLTLASKSSILWLRMSTPLPPLPTPHPPRRVIELLTNAAKEGKLPGFIATSPPVQTPPTSPTIFSVEAFGTVFEHEVRATAQPAASGQPWLLHFSLHLLPKKPTLFLAVIIISIWPGLPMTDAMLRSWIAWYDGLPLWATAAWYLPLTILPLPWLCASWYRASTASANAHALEQRATIEQILAAAPGTQLSAAAPSTRAI